MKTFDYVILGAGSAGCVLANRLSADPGNRVLLVEAGGRAKSLFVRMPAANGFLFGNPAFDWGFESEPQAGLDGRRIYYPRGRGLGGTSLINGMVYMRGNRRDYDAWRDLGLPGWGYDDLLPYFRRAESNARGRGPFHGDDGPLRLGPSASYGPADRLFTEACQQAGYALNPDFNAAEQIGCGPIDVTVHRGRRMSTAAAYLTPARGRRNLTVLTRCTAAGLVIEGRRATGVRLLTRAGAVTVRAEREVLLSLGAFGSPQQLLLSGIGPADDLRRHGIPVAVDLAGVGRGLQDHLNLPVRYHCLDPDLSLARWQRVDRALALGLRYLMTGGGPGAGPFWSTCAFTSGPMDPAYPEAQIYFVAMVVVEDLLNAGVTPPSLLDRLGARLFARGKVAVSGFQLDVNLLRPASRGTVELRSKDPRDAPVIDPGFFLSAADHRAALGSIRRAREIMAQPAFDGVLGPELGELATAATEGDLLAALRRTANTGHHPVSSCRMGAADDAEAVVDAELRVRGIAGLRVIDASIFPTQIAGNPNGPVIAIAEKASDIVLGHRPAAPPTYAQIGSALRQKALP